MDEVLDRPIGPTSAVSVHRDEAFERAKVDLDFLAALAIPEVYCFAFPDLIKLTWQLITTSVLKDEGQDKLALGLPRGFAKTLILKLAVLYVVLYTQRRFVLIVCNTATLAENFLSDVADALDEDNIKRIYGNWRLGEEKDTQGLKKFTFRNRSIILAALGSGSSLRGLNLKYQRPDVIFMDDMQSKEESDSVVDSNKQLVWMLGTLMKANNKIRCTFVFLGNMYPSEGCILKKLKNSPNWISFITGAILEDGESLWPALRSVDSLLDELSEDESMGHPEIFYSEVMNDDEAGSRSTIDFTKINMWNEDPTLELVHEGGWVIIDPSLAKVASDETAIGVFLLFNGEPVCWKVETGKFSEMQKIDTCIKLALEHNLLAIVVESVAYQASLCFWMDLRRNQLGLHALKILEINPRGVAKNSRIINMTKNLTAVKPGERLWLRKSVRSVVTHQLIYWNPMKLKNKDDVLDILAYAWLVINQFQFQLLSAFSIQHETVGAAFSEDLILPF